MPVTVKLSEQFYRRFGHEVVDEMVNWFNQVDDSYRGQLRELNELNFSRFDAKLEQRVAQLDAKLEQRVAQLDAKLEQRTTELRSEFHSGLAMLEGRLMARIGLLEGRFGILEGRLVRWMFVFWAASLGTMLALR